ncbi:hypothetical protein HY029_05020 [Candidatus Gottesmanbacteria bacterium]|nr:hypothetical protein [Candidatus Gottesmanbacteria bacterium]
MLRLYIKTALILFIAILLSVGIDAVYRHTYHLKYKLPQNILVKSSIPDKYQIVKLGNSHSEDGITFDYYRLRSLSLASVAQSFEYDLAMLKMYANQIDKGAVIIINVSPLSFSQKKPGKAESLQFQYYDGRLSPFVIPHLQFGDYLQNQIIPFVRTVYLWREANSKKEQENAMNTFAANWPTPTPQVIPTVVQNNEIIKVINLPKKHITAEEEMAKAPFWPEDGLQKSVNAMVNKWTQTGDFGSQYINANRSDLEELIKYGLDKKWRVVVVSIPISQKLIDVLGRKYMQTNFYEPFKKTNFLSAEPIDLSSYKQLRENAYFFSNSDHLNQYGARIFSHLLLEKLIEKGYVAKDVDGFLVSD